MKKMNSFTKSLLAAAVAIAALALVGCKKDVPVEAQKYNADYLDGKTIFAYEGVDEASIDYENEIIGPVMFEKDETDPDGNTISIVWNYFYVCDKVKVTKENSSTIKFTTEPHDYKYTGYDHTLSIKSFNGTYDLATKKLSLSYCIKLSNEEKDKEGVVISKLDDSLALESLKNVPFVKDSTDVKMSNDGVLTCEGSTYSITSPKLIGYNEWILPKKTGTGKDELRIKIFPNYNKIRIGQYSQDALYFSTEYTRVTFSDFTNTNLTVGTTSNTVKFTPSTTKTNEGIFTSSTSTDKQTYKITSSPNLYTYTGTMGDSSSLSGGKVGATDNMFKLVIKDSKTAELTLGSSKAITLTK